jgi:osmotically-inducible protein OsmY
MDLDRGEMDRETIGTRRLRRDYEGRDYDEFSQLDRERDFIRPQSRGEFGFASESQFDYGRQRSGPRIGVESGSQFGYGRQGSEPRMYGRRSTGQARSYSDLDEDRGWLDRLTDAIASWFGDEEAARRRRMDERHHQQQEQKQKYRGVGPKGYRRSDERIREEINDHLTDNDYLDATFIEVTVTGGEVMLDGIVRDRFSKRLAEDISDRVLGVQNVENRLKVSQLMQPQSETGSQQAVTPPPASKATTTKGS